MQKQSQSQGSRRTASELTEAYFAFNPPVILIVKTLIVEAANDVASEYPSQSISEQIEMLKQIAELKLAVVRGAISAALEFADTVNFNYRDREYTFRRGHLSMMTLHPAESDEA